MKKIFAVLTAALLVLGLFSILAHAQPAGEPPVSPVQTNSPITGSVYYLNFKPEQAMQWNAAAKAFTDTTGIKVTVVTAASGTYEDALRAEMEKNEPPTLFQVNGPVGLRTWKNHCLDLRDTPLYQNLQNDEFALFDGDRVLAVAYAIETYGLIYNKTLLQDYCNLPDAVIDSPDDIRSFETLKAVAEGIQQHRDELGVLGAFTSAGMDASSDWRFKTHLANLPIYYEYKTESIDSTDAIKGTYLDNYRRIWDLYISNATCAPSLIGARTGEDAASEFALGEAVFYQNGTWAYQDVVAEGLQDDELGMLPIYIGVEGEENQGLCTGSENYWCINKNANPEDIEATKAFLAWLIESDEGRQFMSGELGFATPFSTFDETDVPVNALQAAARADLTSGREPVSWAFTTIPSETWKNNLGAALLEYAQGTSDWANVERAFVDGWTAEAAHAPNESPEGN